MSKKLFNKLLCKIAILYVFHGRYSVIAPFNKLYNNFKHLNNDCNINKSNNRNLVSMVYLVQS